MDVDDIIIKPSNFFELLEQKINCDNYQINNNMQKPFRKYTPPPKKNIKLNIPQKNEIKKYRYYADNFQKKKKGKNTSNENEQKEDIKEIKGLILEQDNKHLDYMKKIEEDKMQNKKTEQSLIQLSNNKKNEQIVNNENMNKNNELDSLIKNLEFSNIQNKKFKSNKSLDFQISVQNSSDLNKFINKNKINQTIIKTNNINNLKASIYGELKNSTNHEIKIIPNISNNIPHEDSMQNDINNILNLNNNIEIIQNNNKINTIHSMKHSHSTKSFVFRKRDKPSNKNIVKFEPEKIINNMKNNKNILNNNNDIDLSEISKLEKDINKVKENYEKIKKEKANYENLNRIIQSEIRNFNRKKQFEKESFEKYKEKNIKKLGNEKNKLINEKKKLDELKKKYQEFNYDSDNNSNNNEKSNYSNIIDLYKMKLEEANNKISKLKLILYQLKYNNNENNNNKNTKINYEEDCDDSEDNDDDEYNLVLPDKYHDIKYNLLKTINSNDGKIIKIYDKNKKEIISNEEKKEIYDDKYEIIYFKNGDIKQNFKDKHKQVYYFNRQKITQTNLEKGLKIIKYDNGQIEKHFSNGTKKIFFPDGILKYILTDGIQETYFPDGSMERIDKKGNSIWEYEDGKKELNFI